MIGDRRSVLDILANLGDIDVALFRGVRLAGVARRKAGAFYAHAPRGFSVHRQSIPRRGGFHI